MEYAEFGDLSKLMKDLQKEGKWFSEYKILDLMIQICKGVERIHQRNIAHLDLKPENILVFEDDKLTLKITDFGIAKHLSSLTDYMTASKWTQSYAAPELLKNERFHLEPDIWALGCIFYKLCTTKLPYGVAYSLHKPPSMTLLRNYSVRVRNLILSLLKANRKERPNITQVLEELTDIVKETNSSSKTGNNDELKFILQENRIPTVLALPRRQYDNLKIDRYEKSDNLSKIEKCSIENEGSISGNRNNFSSKSEEKDSSQEENNIQPASSSPIPISVNNRPETLQTVAALQEIDANMIRAEIGQTSEPECFRKYWKLGLLSLLLLISLILNVVICILYFENIESFYDNNKISFNQYLMIATHGIIPLNNQFENIDNIKFHPENYHYMKGSINSFGYYAVSRGYLYNLNEPEKTPLNLEENPDAIYGCIFISADEVLCCDQAGYIYKYVFDTIYTTYNSSLFVNSSSTVNYFMSIIKTSSGYIVVNGEDKNFTGIINVYDLTGNLLISIHSITTPKDIQEIKTNIIISVGLRGYFIHDISNISKPNSMKFTHSKYLLSTISLKIGSEGHYFALGGYKSANYGVVQIYQLKEDLSCELFKEKIGLGRSDHCRIKTLYEIDKGRIFIGGDSDCKMSYIWEYMSKDEPQCNDDLIETGTIIDVVKVKN